MSHAALYATLADHECTFKPEMTGEEIIKECMRGARKNWMTTNETELFNAAVTLAYSKLNEQDKPRLKASLDVMKALNAAMSGVPVDMAAAMSVFDDMEPYPLTGFWKDSKQ